MWNDLCIEWYGQTYIYGEAHRSIDRKKIRYFNISQLVTDEGGWHDPLAVNDSMQLVIKDIAMGPPWHFTHPQTGRFMVGRLEFEHEALYEKSWESFKKHAQGETMLLEMPNKTLNPIDIVSMPKDFVPKNVEKAQQKATKTSAEGYVYT